MAASAHVPLRHVEVAVRGGAISVAVAGEGAPVVLLHGWTLDHRMWSPQIEHLSHNHLLVMPDRRGNGRSSAPPDLALEHEDVARIADYLDLERVSVLGLSQGAVIALHSAHRLRGRIDRVIVSGAPMPLLVERDEAIPLERYRRWAANGDPAAIRTDWLSHDLMRHENPATRDLVETMLADYSGRDLLVGSEPPHLDREQVAQLAMPLLALAGKDENPWRRACAQALGQTAPHGRHALVEGAGHLANLDRPGSFSRAVAEFLGTGANAGQPAAGATPT